MNKYTIKKTYFEVKEVFLFKLFGLNEDNEPMVITKSNFNSLKDYIEEDNEKQDNPNVRKILAMLNEELEKVDEIQVVLKQ